MGELAQAFNTMLVTRKAQEDAPVSTVLADRVAAVRRRFAAIPGSSQNVHPFAAPMPRKTNSYAAAHLAKVRRSFAVRHDTGLCSCGYLHAVPSHFLEVCIAHALLPCAAMC